MVIHGLVAMVLDEFVALGGLEVFADHFGDKFFERRCWRPAKLFFGFSGVTEQGFDFGGAEIAGIDGDDALAMRVVSLLFNALPFPFDFHTEFFGSGVNEVAHAVLHAGSDDEVFRFILLQHEPLHFNVVFGVAPVAFGVHVAKIQRVLQAQFDSGQGTGDLAGDECFAAHGAFMVEENSIAGVNAIGFAVVDGDPVGVELGDSVRASGVEGGGFLLGDFLHKAIEFAGTGLVEAGFLFQAEDADGFEDTQCAQAIGVGGVFGFFETDGNVALRGEVVDFVGLNFLNDADEAGAIGQVAMVKEKANAFVVTVLVEMVDTVGVEETGTTFDAVDDVASVEKKLGEIGAVLTGDAGDEGDFGSLGRIAHVVGFIQLSVER